MLKLYTLLISCTYFCTKTDIIETNPGPHKEKTKNLSCYHWNVNSLIAHRLSKISQLEGYNSVYKHDFICISKMFFDSSVWQGDKNIQLDGNKADHPSNSKRDGVCIFYKETLGVCMVQSLSFSECIFCEVFVQSCKGYVGVAYRSPSQDFNLNIFCQILRKF